VKVTKKKKIGFFMVNKEALATYFNKLEQLNSEEMMNKVDQHLDDEAIEVFIQHLEEFYGVEDDEELGTLAQIMISGFIAGKEIN
jgi:hypothetical protein